jgi:hypothetical protein
VTVKRYSIVARARARAAASTVFTLLKEGPTWPRWTIIGTFHLERPGFHDPSGVGAVRVFPTPFSKVGEEVIALIPNRRLSYVFLSGFSLRNYRTSRGCTPDRASAMSDEVLQAIE